MGKNFEYEWYTISIRFCVGTFKCVYKGKSKEHVIKQIKKEFAYSNSKENLARSWSDPKMKQQMLEIYWDTLTFDHKGYQRLF